MTDNKNPSPVSIPMVSEGRAVAALRQIDALGKSPGHMVPLALRDLVADALKDSPVSSAGGAEPLGWKFWRCRIGRVSFKSGVHFVCNHACGDLWA